MEKPIHLYESKHDERYAIDVHSHPFAQLLYVIEGEGTIRIEDRSFELVPDTVAIIVPYSKHAVASDSRLTLLVLTFDEESLLGQLTSEWTASLFRKSRLMKLNALQSNELRLLLRKLLFEQRREDRFSDWAARIHLNAVFLLLARAENGTPVTAASGLRAERIRHFIDSHYYETIASGELAAKIRVSIRHLNAIFKEHYGTTPSQYLTDVRMSVAKKLLLETDKDIASICFEIGYESLPTFYRTFKKAVQLSPNQYRNQNQHK